MLQHVDIADRLVVNLIRYDVAFLPPGYLLRLPENRGLAPQFGITTSVTVITQAPEVIRTIKRSRYDDYISLNSRAWKIA